MGRRSLIAGLAGWRVFTNRVALADTAAPMPKTPVDFDIPRGACDAHVHVIGEPGKFPLSPHRSSTPPAATARELGEMLHRLGIDRVVIVTPDAYDTDNSATLDAIGQLGRARARGVAWIAEGTPSATLRRMAALGIAGIRLGVYQGGRFDAPSGIERLKAKLAFAEQQAWHVEIATPPDIVAALAAPLAASPVPVVINTFGWAEGGVTQPGFDAVLALVESGRAYVKLAEPYRLSKNAPDYPNLAPVVQTLVAANPDHLLWGSGWPYLSGSAPGGKDAVAPPLPIDAGHLLNLFAQWVPDAATRRKILVDNPARLYRF